MKPIRQYLIFVSIASIVLLGACSKQADSTSVPSHVKLSNLKLGTEIPAGEGKVKVMGVFESMKTPINGNQPKKAGNKFIGVEIVVTTIADNSQLCSIGFVLTTSGGDRLVSPSVYGRMMLMGSMSNFEAVDGAMVYVGKPDSTLKLFFELAENIDLRDVSLSYDPKLVPASTEQKP
jgi:hypothetical protein